METKRSFKDSIVRLAALLGLILVLLLGAWGAILLAFNLPTIAGNVGGSIVSLFNPGTSDTPNGGMQVGPITVTAPESVRSGSSFEFSWDRDASKTYTVSYACVEGLSMKIAAQNGSAQTVPCATQFNQMNASNKMTLTPSITGSRPVQAPIIVTETENGTITRTGSAVVSVTPAATAPTTPTTGTGGTTYVPSGRTQNLYGTADLAVRMTSINSLSSQQGRVAVVFEIENIGTNVAPAGWMFNANLPVGYSYLYTSPTQQALYPGDKVVYTLGFSSAVNNQYCTMQYPNQNCPWYQAPYNPYPYQGTCYRYDGYQNVPVQCTDSDGNPIYTNPNYNQNYNNGYNYSYTNNLQYNGRIVTITVDPRNWVADYNRGNNSASIASPIGY